MQDDLEARFGAVIRELRLAKGMSQEDLSFACQRHRTYVSLIERGKNSPSIRTLWLLAEALEVEPSEIVRRTEAVNGKSTKEVSKRVGRGRQRLGSLVRVSAETIADGGLSVLTGILTTALLTTLLLGPVLVDARKADANSRVTAEHLAKQKEEARCRRGQQSRNAYARRCI